MTNLLIQELPFFLASSLLAGLGLLLVLGLWNCRRIIQGDWGDDSVSPFEAKPLPSWLVLLSVSVPQLGVELRRMKRDISARGFMHPMRLIDCWQSAMVWCGVVCLRFRWW